MIYKLKLKLSSVEAMCMQDSCSKDRLAATVSAAYNDVEGATSL